MRSNILAVTCPLLMSASAAADYLGVALAAYDTQQYDKAIVLLTPLAEAGDVRAQMSLSHIYRCGLGTLVDAQAAFNWTQWAVRQGHPAGIYNLAVMTMNGQGVEADPIGATRLFVKAAELDDPDALYFMGAMYLQLSPATGDVDIGLNYLKRATATGHSRAASMLATVLEVLPLIPHDFIREALNSQIAPTTGCDDDTHPHAIASAAPNLLGSSTKAAESGADQAP